MESFVYDADLSQAAKLINSFDFQAIIDRLTQTERWPLYQAKIACQQYRNFLFLKRKYGNAYLLPPSYDIDEVWHAHILNTQAYNECCMAVFGQFLHHYPNHHPDIPYLTKEKLAQYFEETQSLYHLEFGDYIYTVRRFRWFFSIIFFFNRVPFFYLKEISRRFIAIFLFFRKFHQP